MSFSNLATLTTLLSFADSDMNRNADAGFAEPYVPTAGVLAQRVIILAQNRMLALAQQIDAGVWAERADERAGMTYQLGHRTLTGADYRALLAKVAKHLRAHGLRCRLDGALYVTIDKSLALNVRGMHAAYLRVLASRGAVLPLWAQEVAGVTGAHPSTRILPADTAVLVDGAHACTWGEFVESNAEGVDEDTLTEAAQALARGERYAQPAGGFAGWTLERAGGAS